MTPLVKFDDVYLKREDLNPTGSAKDRAIPFQIQNLVRTAYKSAVISSTGNAAISAQYFCGLENIPLTVFVSPHTAKEKLIKIQNPVISSTPISGAFKYAKEHHAYNLRQSTDPSALEGYAQIAGEIIQELPQVSSIFVPVGSGTTLLGISLALKNRVPIIAVQPANNPTISRYFDQDFIPETSTITDALSVRSLPLKNRVLTAIRESGGSGAVVQDNEVRRCYGLLTGRGISCSPEGGLALAGYYKIKDKFEVGNYPVIILTGANRE